MKKFILPLLMLFSTSVFAQSNDQQPESDTAALEERIATLEKKSTTWDKIAAHLPSISGYVQAGYKWSEYDGSSFEIKRARLNLKGNIVPKFSYRIQLELTSPKIVDTYLQYSPWEQLNFKLGMFKIPFSIESTGSTPLNLEVIDYAMPLGRLMGYNDVSGLKASGRDTGLNLFGGFIKRDGYSIINYDLAVLNGQGINIKDKNDSKDFVTRLRIIPVEGLMVSGSYYWGEYGEQYEKRERYTAGASFDRGHLSLRGEWFGGTTGVKDSKAEYDSRGWYVLAGWRICDKFMPAVRYETFTADTSVGAATRQSNIIAGLTWQPIKHFRFQLNYSYEDCGSKTGKRSGNTVYAVCSASF